MGQQLPQQQPAIEMAIAKQTTSKDTNEATYEGRGRASKTKSA